MIPKKRFEIVVFSKDNMTGPLVTKKLIICPHAGDKGVVNHPLSVANLRSPCEKMNNLKVKGKCCFLN